MSPSSAGRCAERSAVVGEECARDAVRRGGTARKKSRFEDCSMAHGAPGASTQLVVSICSTQVDVGTELGQTLGPTEPDPGLAPVAGFVASAPATTIAVTGLHRLHEEGLPLTVVELGDALVLTARLAVSAVADQSEAGAAEQLVGELAREHRDRVAEPEHVQDELAAQAVGVFVGHLEVRAIAGEIRTDSLVDVGKREAEDPARLEDARSSWSTGTRSS